MRFACSLMLAASLLCGSPMLAQADQTAQPASSPLATYKLTFVVTQLIKGKPEGRRTYTALFTPEGTPGSLRAGNRVPVPTGTNTSGVSTQYQYIDVGVNFDFRTPGELAKQFRDRPEVPLYVNAEVSSYSSSTTPGVNAPLIREEKWGSEFVLPLNKPALLFSSDDPAVDETTQVELTVTRSK